MNTHASIDRRAALRRLGQLGTAALAGLGAAHPAFAAALAAAGGAPSAFGNRWLRPFKGVDDGGPATSDLRCASLAVSGRWPAELRGRFYRNGPAVFERGGARYRHWFDGDGMVQQFSFDGRRVSHLGRLVRTTKLAAERDAGRFLFSAFGTGIASDAPTQGPDTFNTANTSALEHAGRVLAMWEGGSPYALDPDGLETIGPVTWQEGFEQMPFSAHPKLDPLTGALWNIGTAGDRIVVWHVDARGRLVRAQVRASPHPNGMAHDVAVTARHVVLPLPPLTTDFAAIGRGASLEEAFRFAADQPLRILVMSKNDVADARVFELPARMVFHVGNACETRDGQIALSFVGSNDHDFLVRGSAALLAGRPAPTFGSRLHLAQLDLASGRATMRSDGPATEFPRVDPRRVGGAARFLVATATWKAQPAGRAGLFHGVQVTDLDSGRVDRFDYGSDAVVEEHIVVPKPGAAGERDAWLLGTVFDAGRQTTSVNVLDARAVAAGPLARAELPYALPLGFHGNFTAA